MPRLAHCNHCGYLWLWGGHGFNRATCPRCHKTVYFGHPGTAIPIVEGIPGPGDATIRVRLWDETADIVAMIRSIDERLDLPITLDAYKIGGLPLLGMLAREMTRQGGCSGIYPPSPEIAALLTAYFAE